MKIVADDWRRPALGRPGVVFVNKLKRLRHTLKDWNWNTFGNVFNRLKEAQNKTISLEQELQRGWRDEVHEAWESSKKELLQLEKWESEMLCNQARLDWTKFGDHNSKSFHAA